jgi:aryl-alcohol dehydrogenase-like predicted oxidoreductase
LRIAASFYNAPSTWDNPFDLANNYGPPPGSAECNFGRIFQEDFQPWRDELIISTKAGYTMWDGPYGDWVHVNTSSPAWIRA